MYEQIARENGLEGENGFEVPTSEVSVEDWQRSGGSRHYATKTFPSGNSYKGEWLNGKCVEKLHSKHLCQHIFSFPKAPCLASSLHDVFRVKCFSLLQQNCV